MKKQSITFLIAGVMVFMALFSCNTSSQKPAEEKPKDLRIVTIGAAISETVSELGLTDKIVGTDITSRYPEAVANVPKIKSYNNISAESILSFSPTLVLAFADKLSPETVEQLKAAGIKTITYKQDFSVEGTKGLISNIADSLGVAKEKSTALLNKIDTDLTAKIVPPVQKVLFIYARGAGSLMVAGEKTSANSIITLAGGQNAIVGFEDFKPLTSESLIKANPDVILMFDSGLQSLGGMDGLLQVEGVKQTNAGKHKKVIEMEGQLLTGFGPRVGQAIAELSKKLSSAN